MSGQCYSKCRSCGAAIEWITMPSGKKMPLDLSEIPFVPAEGGRYLAITPEGEIIRGWTCSESYEDERWVYARISHFATCPNAQAHRKRGST